MDYNGKYERSCNFSAIFCILLYAHAIQYGINFDNNIEIHLQFQNFQTSAVQPIHSILHTKIIWCI
jgi:hypothetical protein